MKPYYVTKHAVDQVVDRFGWERVGADYRIKQLMQTAVYQGTNGKDRIFDHYNSRTRMILAGDEDRIITVYSMDTVKPPKQYGDAKPSDGLQAETPTLSGAIATAVKRELSKAGREFKRQQRAVIEEMAQAQIEMAEAMMRKVRVHHPPTQAIIQRNIDALNAKIHRKQAEIAEAEAEFAKLQADAQRFVATE